MAYYGLEVYDPAGNLVFDTQQKGWVLIDKFTVAGTDTASKTYPEWSGTGRTLAAIAVESNAGNTATSYNHHATVSGVTVNVSKSTLSTMQQLLVGASSTPPDSTIFVFVR